MSESSFTLHPSERGRQYDRIETAIRNACANHLINLSDNDIGIIARAVGLALTSALPQGDSK